jgi:hypothetical protein
VRQNFQPIPNETKQANIQSLIGDRPIILIEKNKKHSFFLVAKGSKRFTLAPKFPILGRVLKAL